MTPNEMETKPKQKVERREESTRPGVYFLPPVDIFETRDELILLADMPGVPPDGLDVNLEGDELTVSATVRPEDYEGLKPLHVEYGVGGYYRRFKLGEAVDRERIQAQLKNGSLLLRLPKSARARVRRITVQAA